MDGGSACDWIERFCRVPKGPAVGQPVRLLPFQRDILHGIFDTPTRRAIISMGRQNSKTTLCAYIDLLHLCGPAHQRNGLIVSSALTRDQSALIFDAAAKIVRMSPELEATVTVVDHQKLLRCPDLGTTYRALSADAPTQLGLSPFLVVHDELGQVAGPYSQLYDVLESGMGVQRDPLSLIISTQARTDADLLSRLIDDAASGADPKTKLFMWTAPVDTDPFIEETWRLANPALGEFLNIKEVAAQANTARRMPFREASFKNLILNQRIDSTSLFVSPTVWLENAGKPSPLDGATVEGGLDLAQVADLTAFVLKDVDDGSVHVFAFLPAEGIAERSRHDRVEYEQWARDGCLTLTPGRSISYEFVATEMRKIFNRCNVRSVAFDRHDMEHLLPYLARAGFNEPERARFIPHGQGFYGMTGSIKELQRLLLDGKLKHGNQPVLSMCMANIQVATDDAGNLKFSKRKATGRIDVAVALAMACKPQPDALPAPDYQLHFI